MFRCVKATDIEESEPVLQKKLVVVGDGHCGKTCLLLRFSKGEFSSTGYLPTVYHTDVTEVVNKRRRVQLKLCDTAEKEDYDRVRPYSYPNADVVLVCFSVDNPDSLESAKTTWVPEIRHFCGKVPILLVGTKSDLRDDYENANVTCIKQGPVKYKDGVLTAAKLGAVGYFECSAKTEEGVREVFESAAAASVTVKKSHKRFGKLRKRGN